jgi:hypothetical protein
MAALAILPLCISLRNESIVHPNIIKYEVKFRLSRPRQANSTNLPPQTLVCRYDEEKQSF